jgi:peptidoglycan/LPS O-acetylase OafA/YrhL
VVTLLTVVLLAAVGVVEQTARLRGDVIAAVWNVFNWRELTSDRAYADLFIDESPIAHFWSLAIEEQFYIVWPLVLLVVIRVLGHERQRLLTFVAALFAASAVSSLVAASDVVYFATWTRAAEILAGALLAVWLSAADRPSIPVWWRHLAAPALLVIVIAAILTPTTTGWAYSGGLPVFALVSGALIAGVQLDGPVRRTLSVAPLVAVGRVSYGIYLVHWPVFVILDEYRLGVDGLMLATVQIAVTAAISVAMYLVVERPVRRSAVVAPRVVVGLALVMMLVVTLAARSLDTPDRPEPAPAVLGAPEAPPASDDVQSPVDSSLLVEADADAEADSATLDPALLDPSAQSWIDPSLDESPTTAPAPATSATTSTTTTVPAPPEPLTVAIFGDSVPAWLIRDAAASFDRSDVVVLNGAREGCDGMVAMPAGRDRRKNVIPLPEDCLAWTESYPATLATADQTDVSLLVLGQAPTVDRLIEDRWLGPCDSLDWYLEDVAQRVEFLRSQGTEPVLALPARFGQRITYILEDDHADRIACIRGALAATADRLGIDTIDLDDVLCRDDDCESLRTIDGVHVDAAVAPQVFNEVIDRVLELPAASGRSS